MNLKCVYCDAQATKENPVQLWDFNDEPVCYECRQEFLDNEFGFNDKIEA